MNQESKIGIITGRWSVNNKSISKTASKLVDIIAYFCEQIYVISANHNIQKTSHQVHSIKINVDDENVSFLKYLFFVWFYQIKVSCIIIKLILIKKVNVFLFCFGADLLILPMLIVKIFNKKLIIRSDCRASFILQKFNKPWYKIVISKVLEFISYNLADKIAPESKYMIDYYGYSKYHKKITILPLYIEPYFQKYTTLEDREYDIGYIGNFSKLKGILNFASALADIKKELPSIKVLFVGDGEEKEQVKKIVDNINVDATFVDWIKKEELPVYFNKLKVLILPSDKEGMPNAVLEAMACGTLVLATKVGGIPDIIIDSKTGFLMNENSPESISNNTIRIFNNFELEPISEYISMFIRNQFNYDEVAKKYTMIFENVFTDLAIDFKKGT